MVKIFKNSKGMTLIEIILAMAILGIIVAAILSMFSSSYSNIFASGSRTDEVLQVETIVDDLIAKNDEFKFDDDRILTDDSYTETVSEYLDGKGYNGVATSADLGVYVNYDVNYYVESNTIDDVYGYQVTFAKFFKNGTQLVNNTTFVAIGGDDS